MAVVFVMAGLAADLLAPLVGLWFDPLAGVFAAFSVVVIAFVVAPEKKLVMASLTLIGGASMAWYLISPPSSYPQNHANAYEETYLPIKATLMAGAAGWLFCGVVTLWLGRKPNQQLQWTRCAGG